MKIEISKREIVAAIKTQETLLNSLLLKSDTVKDMTYNKICANLVNAYSIIKGAKVTYTDTEVTIEIPEELIVDMFNMYADLIPTVVNLVKLLSTDITVKTKALTTKWINI